MAIVRYTASADTTITNAYEANLRTRGSGSNMGYADSLAVFSIYGQESGSTGQSQELSRILVKFPIDTVSSDRDAGTIPASGSVSFYLKMFNAETPFTLPQDFNLIIAPVSQSWTEGTGLDMDNYQDLGESNWIAAKSTAVAATATVTWYTGDRPEIGDTITIIDAAGLSKTYIAAAAEDLTADPPEWYASNTTTTQVDSLQNCIESANGHDGSITVSQNATGLIMTLTSSTTGEDGNTTITVAGATSGQLNATNFSGGSGHTPWTSVGGDYLTASNYNVLFPAGYENINLDVSEIVERWITSGNEFTNYGFGVHLTASQEAYFSNSSGADSGSVIQNTQGATQSYYIKKFFARSTEFFFKRPVIEARWDSRTEDDRENFYYSSSLAPAADNLNKLILYNYVRGRLVNIPSVGTDDLFVSFYSSSNGSPSGSKIKLPLGGGVVADDDLNATASYSSTGLYSCQVALTAAATRFLAVHDVWHSEYDNDNGTEFYTGSFYPELVPTYDSAPTFNRITSCRNLKKSYVISDKARFRFFVRDKDWSPTIYTVATANNPTDIITSASYSICRVTDNYIAIPYGTGSDLSTYLSYDKDGNYFDLNINLLDPGYMYEIKLSYYNDSIGDWQEQPQTFKFRVEE